MYTKFGLNKSLRSQYTEQKPNSDVYQGLLFCCNCSKNNGSKSQSRSTSNKGHNSAANLWRMTIYNLNVDLVYDNAYAKIGFNKSIRFQDIEKLISDVNQGRNSVANMQKGNLLSET